jgi:hypothetical protein
MGIKQLYSKQITGNFILTLVAMLQTALYNYLRKECDTILDAYTQLRTAPGNHTAIHEIRVGTKKIRAFFALTQQLPGYTFRTGKYLRTLRLLQAIGGSSRATQLQEKQLRHYEQQVAFICTSVTARQTKYLR